MKDTMKTGYQSPNLSEFDGTVPPNDRTMNRRKVSEAIRGIMAAASEVSGPPAKVFLEEALELADAAVLAEDAERQRDVVLAADALASRTSDKFAELAGEER